jgi:hypothetical protein
MQTKEALVVNDKTASPAAVGDISDPASSIASSLSITLLMKDSFPSLSASLNRVICRCHSEESRSSFLTGGRRDGKDFLVAHSRRSGRKASHRLILQYQRGVMEHSVTTLAQQEAHAPPVDVVMVALESAVVGAEISSIHLEL